MSMLTSLALLLLCGLTLGTIFTKIKLPSLIGLLITGLVLGPYVLNLISPQILNISADLRQHALIIILTRAGLSMNLKDLIKVGRPAVLMSIVPAVIEIGGFMVFGTMLLNITWLEAAIMGAVLAAVSPAVVVPRMLKIQEEGYGTDKGIPQMVVASSSVDDVFVIVIFTALIGMNTTGDFDMNVVWQIPVSIVLGISIGALFGFVFALFFKRFHFRDTIKVLVMLSLSFLFIGLEHLIAPWVPFSGLLAVISMGVAFFEKHKICAQRLSQKYNKLWVFAEILLFILIGAEVDISYAISSGAGVIAVMFCALALRIIGVFLSLIKTPLNMKERLFCAIAYVPKATVQAAIGAVPLAMGLACGQIVLTAAVLSILITAPLGAFATDFSYKKLLMKSDLT